MLLYNRLRLSSHYCTALWRDYSLGTSIVLHQSVDSLQWPSLYNVHSAFDALQMQVGSLASIDNCRKVQKATSLVVSLKIDCAQQHINWRVHCLLIICRFVFGLPFRCSIILYCHLLFSSLLVLLPQFCLHFVPTELSHELMVRIHSYALSFDKRVWYLNTLHAQAWIRHFIATDFTGTQAVWDDVHVSFGGCLDPVDPSIMMLRYIYATWWTN